jgi:hypothetical protein
MSPVDCALIDQTSPAYVEPGAIVVTSGRSDALSTAP